MANKNSVCSRTLFPAAEEVSDPDALSTMSNNYYNDMEEECTYAGEFVDVHGNPIEVLRAENGQLFVNLDDVRTAGFDIYKRETYENTIITRDVDLRHFENYLLNQGMKYVWEMKKSFDENEMLAVFERVKAKLQGKSGFGEGRIINTPPNKKTTNVSPTNPAPPNRSPRQVPDNLRPSFSHFKPPENKNVSDFAANGFKNKHNHRNFKSEDKSRVHSKNQFQDNRRSNEENTKKWINSVTQQNQMRKPKFFDKVMANNKADQEPEESWEGVKTSVPKSKSRGDSSSVSSEKKTLNIERILLANNNLHKVRVSHLPDKKTIFYAQPLDKLDQVEQILVHVNTEDINLPEISVPTREMLCIAYFEDCWYRAVVLKENHGGGAFVELIDYGNRETITTPLREMSQEMKIIPGLAVRCSVHPNTAFEKIRLAIEQDLEIFVKKHYDDKTHVIEVKGVLDKLNSGENLVAPPPKETSSDQPSQKPETSQECFTKIPPSSVSLINGESVMIVGYNDKNFFLRNKESAKNCKDLINYLSKMEKKPIVDPKVGQLVLCSLDGIEGLHRAVIEQIDNSVAKLQYLDYYGGETLTLKSLRNVDKFLANCPITKIESPVVDYLKKISEKSEAFLSHLIMTKTKLKVLLKDNSFDLQLTDGDKTILLSQKIEEIENPPKLKVEPAALKVEPSEPKVESSKPKVDSPKPKVETPKREVIQEPLPIKTESAPSTSASPKGSDKFVNMAFTDMEYLEGEMGEAEYFCYNCSGNTLTLLSQAALSYLPALQIDNPTDTQPHKPDLFEMCLAKYEDVWYRATVTDIQDDYEVVFVDFGNTERVPASDIRKFPESISKIPILGLNAYIMGIPENPKLYARIKELIPDETSLIINIKAPLNTELHYGVEIPSIMKILKNENLI